MDDEFRTISCYHGDDLPTFNKHIKTLAYLYEELFPHMLNRNPNGEYTSIRDEFPKAWSLKKMKYIQGNMIEYRSLDITDALDEQHVLKAKNGIDSFIYIQNLFNENKISIEQLPQDCECLSNKESRILSNGFYVFNVLGSPDIISNIEKAIKTYESFLRMFENLKEVLKCQYSEPIAYNLEKYKKGNDTEKCEYAKNIDAAYARFSKVKNNLTKEMKQFQLGSLALAQLRNKPFNSDFCQNPFLNYPLFKEKVILRNNKKQGTTYDDYFLNQKELWDSAIFIIDEHSDLQQNEICLKGNIVESMNSPARFKEEDFENTKDKFEQILHMLEIQYSLVNKDESIEETIQKIENILLQTENQLKILMGMSLSLNLKIHSSLIQRFNNIKEKVLTKIYELSNAIPTEQTPMNGITKIKTIVESTSKSLDTDITKNSEKVFTTESVSPIYSVIHSPNPKNQIWKSTETDTTSVTIQVIKLTDASKYNDWKKNQDILNKYDEFMKIFILKQTLSTNEDKNLISQATTYDEAISFITNKYNQVNL